MENWTFRRLAPLAGALLIGGAAGAAVYATVRGGGPGSGISSAPTAYVPSQPASTTQTVSTLTQLYKDVSPGVVDITVTGAQQRNFFGGSQQSEAEGSGFVIDTKGDIVTNAHVVAGETAIKVRFKDGKTATATLVGQDPSSDIAVVKVNVEASELHPLTLGDSSTVEPGESVVAIGSPFGLAETMTAGIISAVDRTITAPNNYSIAGAIQTDAAINHGNSGGPLLTTSGVVIGVNAQIDSDSGDNAGVGFALPINSVRKVALTLVAGSTVKHAYLGVQVADVQNGSGAQVGCVVSGSPAANAGIKAGDVVTAIGGKPVASSDDLVAIVSSYVPGDKVALTITRNGSPMSVDVTFGSRPSTNSGCS